MKHQLARLLLVVVLLVAGAPAVAHADIGGSIVERFWESALSMWQSRLQSGAPSTVTFLEEAEKVFLGQNSDPTNIAAVQDAYKAMRVAGLLLLGLCTVLSLAGLTEASLVGNSSDFSDWIRRFCIATFMTMGGIHFYGIWIRIFNGLLAGFRQYLDTHWSGPSAPSALYLHVIGNIAIGQFLLWALVAVVCLVVLLILSVLIGGIRMAELTLAIIIAPLVWPLYLLPSLEDIPKTAFRSFLGLNAVLLLIVAMTRLAVRMAAPVTFGSTLWNLVPALSLLVMTIFLPSMIKRLLGQGNTGSGILTTAMYALAGMKGLSMAATGAAGGGGAAVSPPSSSNVPQAPSGASSYPLAPLGGSQVAGGSTARPGASQTPPIEEVWVTAPRQVTAGAAAGAPAIEAPYVPQSADEYVIDLGQSAPGSDKWDTVVAIHAFMKGSQARSRVVDPDPK